MRARVMSGKPKADGKSKNSRVGVGIREGSIHDVVIVGDVRINAGEVVLLPAKSAHKLVAASSQLELKG